MIIMMEKNAGKLNIGKVIQTVQEMGLRAIFHERNDDIIIAAIGKSKIDKEKITDIPGVKSLIEVSEPYKLASRKHKPEGSIVMIGDVAIGDGSFVVIAGPCSLENEEQAMASANILKKLDVKIMRASAFKPRTSPYSFQGMGVKGLELLKKVREKTGLLVETEVMDVRDVKIASELVDVLRIGSRNMQNFDLLKEVGKVRTPVILKRGLSATIEEFLMSAEYILASGNPNVILCERGIRTFESKEYRNTLDIAAIPILKKRTHLPVIVDPSHAAGNRHLVIPLSKAAVAIGADGLLVEMHPNPDDSWSDADQALSPGELSNLLREIKPICNAVNMRN